MHVQQHAQHESDAAYDSVLQKIKDIGKGEKELQRVIRYVRNEAPIIVHLNLDNSLDYLISDTHYRSCFETHTGTDGGNLGTRSSFEGKIFGSAYDNSKPIQVRRSGVFRPVGSSTRTAQREGEESGVEWSGLDWSGAK